MDSLAPHEITVMLLALGVLLGTARLLGELAQRLHQPAVLGEILAGILLGPTVLGTLAPPCNALLFPKHGANAITLDGIATLAVVLFLLVAGMEVDLSTVWRRGKVALKVGTAGILVPLALGFLAAWIVPQALGRQAEADPLLFALFLGTALSISALPVIAKTLMDLDLYRSDLGMVIVSAAIFNDLIGWIVFAVILGLMGTATGHAISIPLTIGLILGFAAVMLTAGRWLVHAVLPYLQAYAHWPGGVLSFALTLALFGAALTEWIGIHAIFGSFLVGVAVGDSSHLREQTRTIINDFVSFIFAPVFFASIGLKVNFATHFDAPLVLTVLAIACAGKLAGATLGARWGGMPARDAWAVGFGMNARGAMEIILGLLALEAGVIRQRLFVALVIMALVTSMMSGPAMQIILQLRKPWRLLKAFSSKAFLRELAAVSRREAVHELTAAACAAGNLDENDVESAVWTREEAMPTGIGKGIALPHARLPGLREPLVAVGISEAGIDFDAPDGEPAHGIFLILTPQEDPGAQLKIAAELSHLFHDRQMLAKVLRVKNFAEFLALMKSATPPQPASPAA
ncbi:MAG: cation:proton antiporter [Pirellulales bacterium]|nr:cation:proton antiporter [Pirellulales bacterium]